MTEQQNWQAVQSRDARADGSFVYAVTSTGVYCRPSCPSRPKRRENVRFYRDAHAAEVAGFRACQRCRPQAAAMSRAAELVAQACRLLAAAEREPTLAELASALAISPGHLQRTFKAELGLSPKRYALALRKQRLRDALPTAETVTAALLDAGFATPARGYAMTTRAGIAPARQRRGSPGEIVRHASARSSLGEVLIGATPRGLCLVAFVEPDAQAAELQRRFPQAECRPDAAGLQPLLRAVLAAIDDPAAAAPHLPQDIRGTAFQERVWQALAAIPAGETRSYAELAQAVGQPSAVRAVAAACGANALAVLVPCHRVIGKSGSLTGYRWGVERKRALLARERAEEPNERVG